MTFAEYSIGRRRRFTGINLHGGEDKQIYKTGVD